MKIKSQTDVITNSSSELFTIKAPGKTKVEILDILTEYHKSKVKNRPENIRDLPWSEKIKYDLDDSGMGGILEVKDFKDEYEEHKSSLPINKQSQFTEEMFSLYSIYSLEEQKEILRVDIDENFLATCQFMFDNFEVLENYSGLVRGVYDKDGLKIIRTTDWEEWRDLSSLEQYGKVYYDNYDVESWE